MIDRYFPYQYRYARLSDSTQRAQTSKHWGLIRPRMDLVRKKGRNLSGHEHENRTHQYRVDVYVYMVQRWPPPLPPPHQWVWVDSIVWFFWSPPLWPVVVVWFFWSPPPCGLWWWYGSSGPPPCGLWWWYVGMLVCWYVCMLVCMYVCVNRRFSPICMFLVDIEVICSHSRRQEIHSFGMTVVFSEDLQ